MSSKSTRKKAAAPESQSGSGNSSESPFEFAIRSRQFFGESVNGDQAISLTYPEGLLAAVIDGLGHGFEANQASTRGIRVLREWGSPDLLLTMNRLHTALQGTRGAAAGLAWIDLRTRKLTFVGIGNVTLRRFGGSSVRLQSQPGIVGELMRRPRIRTVALEPGDCVLMYSDGIRDRFELEDYPQILIDHPDTICNKVLGLFGKAHDDMTCLAVRMAS